MQTPWGWLANLDLTSLDLCRKIISSDNHQLAEGLVVESLIDQIYERIPPLRPWASGLCHLVLGVDAEWNVAVLSQRRI